MTKFFLWAMGEDVSQELDVLAKVCFNTMMLFVSFASVLCVAGILFSVYSFINLCL